MVGSRGSMLIECSIEPSGVFCSGHSAQVAHIGWSFQPSTGVPGVAAVVGAEQTLRRRAGVPDARLVGMARREPEHRRRPLRPSVLAGSEGRRSRRLGPGRAEVVGPEHGRPEVPGAAADQQPRCRRAGRA